MSRRQFLESALERGLFASRWLMAPFYVGLVFANLALLIVFFQELWAKFPLLFTVNAETGYLIMREEEVIMLALSLIDMSLAANLVIIVIFAGYENFVSKMDVANEADRPEWMGHVDFSGLKLKLVASIVAISGISLLKNLLEAGELESLDVSTNAKLMWLVIVHITFVVSGVLLALMDWIVARAKPH